MMWLARATGGVRGRAGGRDVPVLLPPPLPRRVRPPPHHRFPLRGSGPRLRCMFSRLMSGCSVCALLSTATSWYKRSLTVCRYADTGNGTTYRS
eukprot:3272298-Rhodomonas_salina.3